MDGQPFQTIPNFVFHDCINSNGSFEQLMNLINGGNAVEPIMFNDDQICPITPGDMFCFSSASVSDSNISGSILSSLTTPFDGDVELEEQEEDSSMSIKQSKKRTVDRARMLISERQRWSRMEEKLLALRALVPNISKMDKASMVGDAILYVQNLQMQIKRLRAEVAGLELSLGSVGGREADEVGRERFEELLASPKPKKVQVVDIKHPGCRKIFQMDVIQVGEREFYVRSTCNRGEGVAVALYRTLESLTRFDIQSSNVTAVSDRFVLTFTLNVRKAGEEMNVTTLKKLVTNALLSQGFELKTTAGDP